MKRFWVLFAIFLTTISFLAAPAEAKRFGGGTSLGKQRSVSPQQTQQASPYQPGAAAQSGAPAQPARSKWLGPLAGLAAGLGLAALFSSLGLNADMGMLLTLFLGGMLLMLLMSLFRRSAQPATQYAGAGSPYHDPQPLSGGPAASPPGSAGAGRIPADFPVEAFLRSAKTSFIRLQTANDRKDLDDIREYTTPEMFAEISMQIRERDSTPQHTEVLALNAGLLEVASEADYAVASVRMSGQLRENNAATENFDEIWHVQKNLRDPQSVWLLAGIQQVA